MMAKYDKEKNIGSGTFGNVWLVKSKLSRHAYVLKEINLNSLNDVEQKQALNEATVLSQLKHKNIIRYKEAWIDEKKYLQIVMEYAEGGDLDTALCNQNGIPFPEHRIISWFIQICLALQYIHFKNILHRDLKSQNIFLTRTKIIKVGDFGIARLLRRPDELVKTAIGTPYYLSPEIFQRKPYNYKSDIWALGCVLFEMAALEHAFKANDFFQLANLVLNGRRRDLPRNCSPVIKELVQNLLKINPEERPSTGEILENPALQTYLSEYMASQSSRENSLPLLNGKCEKHFRKTSANEAFRIIKENCSNRRSTISSFNPRAPKRTNGLIREAVKSRSINFNNRSTASKKYQKQSFSGKSVQESESSRNCVNKTFTVRKNKSEKVDFIVSCDTYVLPSANPRIRLKQSLSLSKSDESLNKFYECVYQTALKGIRNIEVRDHSSHYSNGSYCNDSTMLASERDSTLTEDRDDVFTDCNDEINNNTNQVSVCSVPAHCSHFQCHQCILDTLWKNRIRSSVRDSVDTDEYSRLKNKLLQVYKGKLFEEVHQSLIYDWDANEQATSKKFKDIMNSLNYDQVQNLPLMMQLIQLDLLMKPTKD